MSPSYGENQPTPSDCVMEEASCNPTVSVKTYVSEIKSSIAHDVWNRIVSDKQVRRALTTVARSGYSHAKPKYHATAKLLNCISKAYLEATQLNINPDTTPAIVFSSTHDKYIPGDYLGASIRTDITAFMSVVSTLSTALRATAKAPFDEQPNFPRVLGFGEWELESGGWDRVLRHLSALKRYRPDLPNVHALVLRMGGLLTLASLNACGSWSSETIPLGFKTPVNRKEKPSATNSRSKNVVLLYQDHAARDTRFSLVSSDDAPASARWQITLGNLAPIVRPFYAMVIPGRMTWASYSLDPTSPALSLANGFFKTAWQDVNAYFHESKLLHRAHRKSWLPGLVRHWSAARDPARMISLHDPPARPYPLLEEEYIYLASLRHPLSQCRSALHFLKTIYDAAETHLQLTMRGVLHGDMSWFNVLCNPWHDDATLTVKPVAKGIPCIAYILTGDAENSQPCALLLDLDHAADVPVFYADDYAGPRKSGTPMFMSIELASNSRHQCGSMNNLTRLAERLRVLDGHPDLFSRAFPGPNGDDNFMENFLRVVELEKARIESRTAAHTDPNELHRPDHDMESLYWIVVWGLSRACPLGLSPHGTLGDSYSEFVEGMLEHEIGFERAYRRPTHLYGFGPTECLFHPLLRQAVYPVVRDLATYFAIPWSRYATHVDPFHAHVAIRRLLLPLIDDITNGRVADIFFDTTQPRTAYTWRSVGEGVQAPPNAGTPWPAAVRLAGGSAGSMFFDARRPKTTPDPEPEALPQEAPAKPAPNASRAEDDSEPDRKFYMKHLQAVYAADAIRSARLHEEQRALALKRLAEEQEINQRAYERAKEAAVKRDARDVDALIDMFRTDRKLWFGYGFRTKAEGEADAT